jgi:hypothetical protein
MNKLLIENNTKQEIIKIYFNSSLNKNFQSYFCDSGNKILCKKSHSCIAMVEAGLL